MELQLKATRLFGLAAFAAGWVVIGLGAVSALLGIAFALKYKGLKGCCLTYLGDGAVNQGVFHESLNIAALWDIPVVYIIENNRYAMGTSIERASATARKFSPHRT